MPNRLFCRVLLGPLLVLGSCQKVSTSSVDLKTQWDTSRVLENPHKGWYHHYLDNRIDRYGINDDSVLDRFPGMDHLYLRLAWSFLEPEEGEFDWSRIEKVVEKYVPKGLKISFRITSKETGGAPTSVAQEVNGVMYATPYWVRKAGAKGVVAEQWGTESWTPDWDDPVYLEKLDNFQKVFAERYDGKPWVSYVDVGSIGEWGEGHTSFSTRIPPTVAEVKANIDIFLKHFQETQLVVADDLLYYGKPDAEVQELLDYAISRGITLRDDSPLVGWYVENHLKTWSVSHPHFYDPLFLAKPIILECQHYHMVLHDSNWLGRNGEDPIPAKGVTGAEILRGAVNTLHATYIGYHGSMEKWLEENPELTEELANLCGYWYFPVEVRFPERLEQGEVSVISVDWLNRGVAPAYLTFGLRLELQNLENGEGLESVIADSGNRKWIPGKLTSEDYPIQIPGELPPGKYSLKMKLHDQRTDEDVEMGLREDLRDDKGYYFVSVVAI